MTQLLGITWIAKVRKVADLKKWDKNPRKITEANYTRLKEKMLKEGMHQVLTIDTDNTVLSGNQRLSILQELGIEDVWCMVPERALTELERDKVGIQSNIIEGIWDTERLTTDFEVPMLLDQGFTRLQLGMKDLEEDNFDADKEMENVKVLPQAGDIYQLGEHRIMCGDSTSIEDVEKLMDGKKAQLAFCDPPYSVDYQSASGNSYNQGKYEGKEVFNDDKTQEQAADFYAKCLKSLYVATKDNACFYWWYADKQEMANRLAIEATGWKVSQVIMWLKPPMLKRGLDYLRAYEPCLFGWKDGKVHFTTKMYGKMRDVFNLDHAEFMELLDVWYEKRDSTQDYVHPTQKPIRLCDRALKKHSEIGDIVVDLFSGSGSTIMGCAQGQRVAFVMELDPKYVHAGIKRFLKAYPDVHTACVTRPMDMALFKA